MDILNNKIHSGQEETKFNTQNVGLYGFDADTAGGKWRRLACDSEGKQKIEATLELDSSTLAKDATLTNGSQLARCMGITGGGAQQQMLVETNGSAIIGGGAVKTGADSLSNTTHLLTSTNGGLLCGNTVGDGSGTATSLKTASDGSVHVVVENSDNVLIKGVQDGTTTQKDAKTNSNGDLRSALIGNTVKDGTGDNHYVLVDSDGKLQTSGGGGGGGTQYNMGDALGATPTGTVAIGRDTSGNAQALQVSTAGNQFVELADFAKGNTNMANSFCVNVASDQSTIDVQTLRDADSTTISTTNVLANATFTSASVNMNGFSQLMVIGNTTNLSDPMNWEYSFDDATFFKGQQVVYDFSTGDFAEQPNNGAGVGGARYIRVTQTDTTTTAFSVQFASSKR